MPFKNTAILFSFLTLLTQNLFGQSQSENSDELVGARFANGIAAIVEDKIITAQDVRREIAPYLQQIEQDAQGNYQQFRKLLDEAEDAIIQQLTDSHLIVKEFYADKGQFPSSYIRNEVNERIIKQFNGERSQFLAYLKSIGKTPEEYDTLIRDEMIVGFMEGKSRKSETFVSPVKIEEFYEENKKSFFQEEAIHLRLIKLAQITDESNGLLKQTAEQIVDELNNGADFAELAKKHSQDSKRSRGGDWGWIERKSLIPELSDIAFALEKGKHSNAISVKSGFFILYAEDHRKAGHMPIEDVREDIEDILASKMAREAQDRWLERLRRDGYVRRFN